MQKTKTHLVLAIALLYPMIAGAQDSGNSSGQSKPPASSDPQAAVKAAKDKVEADQTAIKADKEAAKTACQTKGADCDAAKAKVESDKTQLKTDKDNLKTVWKQTKGAGGDSGRQHRRERRHDRDN